MESSPRFVINKKYEELCGMVVGDMREGHIIQDYVRLLYDLDIISRIDYHDIIIWLNENYMRFVGG